MVGPARLRLVTDLTASERHSVEATVGDLDWRVSNLPDGPQLAESYVRRARGAAWAVFSGDEPAGFFALLPYPPIPGIRQTSTYLVPAVRGSGLNSQLKRAAFTAAIESEFRLVMSIDVRNARSTAASAKLVDAEPAFVWESEMRRLAWVYDFSTPHVQLRPGPPINRQLVDTICAGINELRAE